MNVRDIMTTPVATCTPGTSLAVAARRMRDADYGTLPVIDAGNHVIGIITDRDICLAMGGSQRSALHMTVHEAMTEHAVSAGPDMPAQDALALMKAARVRRLPVCSSDGALLGLVSIDDIVTRGLESGGLTPVEVVHALRTIYVRVPAAVEATPGNGFMPG